MKHGNSNFTVLMSAYKGDEPKYLAISLKSIYDDQTLKPNQIVLVADGELTLEQHSVINNFQDSIPRGIFTAVYLEKNAGLATALNEGLKHCRYDLVARMDADDISLPLRFEKQVQFMLSNPDVDVCGSYIDEVKTTSGEYISTRKVPLTHGDIVIFSKKRSPVSHPSVIFRKEKVDLVNGYPQFRKSQDFALWSLMLKYGCKFANLNETLLQMRTGDELFERRGIHYLKFEYQVLKFQKNIGFINNSEFVKNVFMRSLFRMLPGVFKKMLYKLLRKRG